MQRSLAALFLCLAPLAARTADFGTSTVAPEIALPQPGPPYLQLAPMLGHVSASEARIWLKATGPVKASVLIGTTGDLGSAREVAGPALAAESDFAGVVVVPELKPATRYFYSVLLDGQPALARPWPSFSTAPVEGTRGKLRFGFGSCAGKEPWLDAATWAEVDARARVDLFLLLGDIHYANTPDAPKQRAGFIAHRSYPGYGALFKKVPVFALWDDHDFGPNDSDGTFPGKEESLKTFTEFFANPAAGQPDDPGIYFKATYGAVDFFMLDGRYHRSPNKAPEDGMKTMLGAKQLAWLKRELLASKALVKVIGSGSEWQSDGSLDSWKSFRREEDDLFAFLDEHGMKNVLLLSGDRHFTGAYQVRGRYLEVTSGPLGSPGGKPKPLPEMILRHDTGRMFCVYEIDTVNQPPAVTLEVYQTGIGLVEKRAFPWDEIIGATRMERSGSLVPKGEIRLLASAAQVHGEKLRYEPEPHKSTLGYWTQVGDWVSWTFNVPAAGKYEVDVLQGCNGGGSEVAVEIGGQTLTFTVENTGHFQHFKARTIGTVELPVGPQTLAIRPKTKQGAAIMDCRRVLLRPVE